MGNLAYQRALPPGMSRIDYVFHVSQLRKYVSYPSSILEVELLLIKGNVNEKMKYEEVPIRVMDTKYHVLRCRTIPYIKIQWSNHMEREATWEFEERMRTRHPHLFKDLSNSSFENETSNKEGGM
ncbi:uncharacterized protein [Primulina huaijiensis]|uniref:uncharacterized protein n=1 Tax=Primulina huaijiensis TaxID=1492673 RepID=UPI003CC78027